MAIDLSVIDTKIRKLQKLRGLLADQETRELISDPEVLAMLTGTNGNGHVTKTKVEPEHREDDEADEDNLPAEGTLRRKIFDTAMAHADRFDARDIYNEMAQGGWQFKAADPMVGINGMMKRMIKQGFIRRVKKGSGRQPHVYEVIQREGK